MFAAVATLSTPEKLLSRFPRTQKAIGQAVGVADAAILFDNSRELAKAFSVCRVQLQDQEIYDYRTGSGGKSPAILEWLDVVAPLGNRG